MKEGGLAPHVSFAYTPLDPSTLATVLEQAVELNQLFS